MPTSELTKKENDAQWDQTTMLRLGRCNLTIQKHNKEHCVFKAVNLTATTVSHTGNRHDKEEEGFSHTLHNH